MQKLSKNCSPIVTNKILLSKKMKKQILKKELISGSAQKSNHGLLQRSTDPLLLLLLQTVKPLRRLTRTVADKIIDFFIKTVRKWINSLIECFLLKHKTLFTQLFDTQIKDKQFFFFSFNSLSVCLWVCVSFSSTSLCLCCPTTPTQLIIYLNCFFMVKFIILLNNKKDQTYFSNRSEPVINQMLNQIEWARKLSLNLIKLIIRKFGASLM